MFVSRIINSLKSLPSSGKRRVSTQLKQDVKWWLKYVEAYDGVNIIPNVNWSAPDVVFSVDSCLSGCGGWSNGEYFHSEFPKWVVENSEVFINELEALALIVGLKIWKNKSMNRNILIYCDNQVTVDIVNTGKARNKFAQQSLREICWITAKNNSGCAPDSGENRKFDLLSRWHLGVQFRDRLIEEMRQWNLVHKIVEESMSEFSHKW